MICTDDNCEWHGRTQQSEGEGVVLSKHGVLNSKHEPAGSETPHAHNSPLPRAQINI
jgi:hypothetical protein